MSVWGRLKHFKENENWGDPSLIDDALLLRLDAFREDIGVPIVITSGTQGKHCLNSWHYQGLAVDFVVPTWRGTLLELFISALRFGFAGVGVYPHWAYEEKPIGGLHVDMRPRELHQKVALWLGIKEKDGSAYLPITSRLIKKYLS